MKKLVLLMNMITITSFCNEYSFLSKKDAYVSDYSSEEYSLYDNKHGNEDIMASYDEHVCDHVKPPKTSQPVALLTQLGCSVLVHYIALQEKVKLYFGAVKHWLKHWLHLSSVK